MEQRSRFRCINGSYNMKMKAYHFKSKEEDHLNIKLTEYYDEIDQ